MEQQKQWHIVYTRAGGEHKVCESLRRKRIICFYPANRMIKTSYGREQVVFIPIIERYVFVYISPDKTEEAKSTDGVINIVHWLSKPVIISKEDFMLMKHFCELHNNIHLEKTKVLSLERASVSTHYSDQDTDGYHLCLPVLGYTLKAEERKTRVKVITVNNDYHTKPEANNQYAEAR